MNILKLIKGLLPMKIFWAIIFSLIGGLVMYIIKFAPFYIGFTLSFIAFYVFIILYIFGRQIYWFFTKKGDYSDKR